MDGSTEDSLEESIEEFVSEIINAKVEVDLEQGQMSLPAVLLTYKNDFGGSEQTILQFVFRYLSEEYDYEQIS